MNASYQASLVNRHIRRFTGIKLEVAGYVPVVVNSVHGASNINAGKITGSAQRSMVDASIYSHSGGVRAVPVMNFGE